MCMYDDFDGIKFALPVEFSEYEVKAVGVSEDIDWIVVKKMEVP